MESKIVKSALIINDLKKAVYKLNQNCNDCNNYTNDVIEDINEKLIELRLLLQSIPIHNEILSDLYEIIEYKED